MPKVMIMNDLLFGGGGDYSLNICAISSEMLDRLSSSIQYSKSLTNLFSNIIYPITNASVGTFSYIGLNLCK